MKVNLKHLEKINKIFIANLIIIKITSFINRVSSGSRLYHNYIHYYYFDFIINTAAFDFSILFIRIISSSYINSTSNTIRFDKQIKMLKLDYRIYNYIFKLLLTVY